MTPRYFHLLRERVREKRRFDLEVVEVMLGELIEVVRLSSFNQYDPPLTAGNLIAGGRQFMPSEWQSRAEREPTARRMTRKERERIVQQRRDYWKMVSNAGG
jgi:hypothetical protein